MQIKFDRLLQKELAPLLRPILELTCLSVGVYNLDDRLLLGEDQPDAERYPIEYNGEIVAWVQSQGQSALFAQVITELINQAVEKKLLANEVLDKYREINLLYTIAERLTNCRQLDEVAILALEEAQRLIQATNGVILLLDTETKMLRSIDVEVSLAISPILFGKGIEGYVAQTGVPEVVNDVPADPRCLGSPLDLVIQSMLCAPLKSQGQVIGVISIYNKEPANYTAADLKLLTAIALQSTPAIESALFYQKQMEEARLREEKLQAQLDELRVEIDQAKLKQTVKEITETDFFKDLQQKAKKMRQKSP